MILPQMFYYSKVISQLSSMEIVKDLNCQLNHASNKRCLLEVFLNDKMDEDSTEQEKPLQYTGHLDCNSNIQITQNPEKLWRRQYCKRCYPDQQCWNHCIYKNLIDLYRILLILDHNIILRIHVKTSIDYENYQFWYSSVFPTIKLDVTSNFRDYLTEDKVPAKNFLSTALFEIAY